jgi:2-polyprenyl-3-methyl-5-hydroxy-6-metoxy-1,4-benzoquinol methylase
MSNYSDSHFDESSQNTSWYKVFHLIPEKSKVLDIGCSSGNFGVELIKRKNCTVDGIELDKKDFAVAKKKLRKVYQKNVETDNLNDLDKDYDVIYFGDVIEHLKDPIPTLERIKVLLKPKGHILFSIPNMGHVGVRLDLLKGEFNYTETGLLDKTHLHFYTQDEVVRVFNEAGYKIEVLDFVQKDYPRALLKKYLNDLGLEPKDKFYNSMSKTNASAFQFVGTAIPSKKSHQKLKEFGPIDLFEGFYTNMKNDYQNQINELNNEIKNLNSTLKYKISHPFRSAAGSVARRVKRP